MAKAKEVTLSTEQEYRQAVAADPQSAEAQSNLGWWHYGSGQWAEATKAFTDALRLDPNLADAAYGLALTYKASGAKALAVERFEQAVQALGALDDKPRAKLLTRLARGHINVIQSGHWKLANFLAGER